MALDCKPKFVTFDMNGTLIQFRINDAIRRALGDRLPAEIADDFLRACSAYRIDECMGEYKAVPPDRRSFFGTNHAPIRPGVPR